MKKEVGFLGGCLSGGGQGGRPWAILLVGEKHQEGRKASSTIDVKITP